MLNWIQKMRMGLTENKPERPKMKQNQPLTSSDEAGRGRLNQLIGSLNNSDLMHGVAAWREEDCEIAFDYGWTHALYIPSGFAYEVHNGGWIFEEDYSNLRRIMREEFLKTSNQTNRNETQTIDP